ncbi:CGNR zinc finger domain-containing protein [Allokutzneria sp. A3M-2-11 16]|uniref:CGNR zinc finger domain-containing protein n=1 Tax=Allokutzneria sp. A3M-2-11 16 TaxID=2962043 RepID=UPI0020B66653|nr:CGNR zinc finger domain-containing protein [Allokutzneria sp. A3M-2-11 16]MCP3803032.1 CGNR zinc finger domain-containing protein [Allokutzneria sp. A3M-2-11 16]
MTEGFGMDIGNSHHALRLETAVDLVNALTGENRGGMPAYLSAEEVERLAGLAVDLRAVIVALISDDHDGAAGVLNRLLADSDARPRLRREGDEAWHLTFHAPGADFVRKWTAGLAVAFAAVLGDDSAQRLGCCEAPRCDRVFIDTSQGRTKRFCGVACQNRVKAAAYRRRGKVVNVP